MIIHFKFSITLNLFLEDFYSLLILNRKISSLIPSPPSKYTLKVLPEGAHMLPPVTFDSKTSRDEWSHTQYQGQC